jgi:hypothetical protein
MSTIQSSLTRSGLDTTIETVDVHADLDLFALANLVAEMVDAPIIIDDNGSRVLAFSGGQENTDEQRQASILGLRVPDALQQRLREARFFRKLADSPGPIYWERPDVMPRVAIAVRSGHEILGSIWGVVPGRLPPEKEEAWIDAAKLVSLNILRNRYATTAAMGLEPELVQVLLKGGPEAVGAGQRLGLRGADFRVIAIGVQNANADESILHLVRCRDLLAMHLSPTEHSLALPIGSTLYCVLSLSTRSMPADVLRSHLETFAARAQQTLNSVVQIGIGPKVASLTEIHVSSRGAQRALRVLAQTTQSGVVDQDDVQARAALMEFVDAHQGDATLLGGVIGELHRSDTKVHTEYVRTLRAYLNNLCSVEATARELGVHRNTIAYRLQQMKRLAELNLEDPVQRLGLMLQLHLMDVANPPSA